MSKRKISELPSELFPVKSRVDVKAMRVPSPLIDGEVLNPPLVKVTSLMPQETESAEALVGSEAIVSPSAIARTSAEVTKW